MVVGFQTGNSIYYTQYAEHEYYTAQPTIHHGQSFTSRMNARSSV